MIVPQEEINKYLGKRLDDLEGKVQDKTLEKLRGGEEYTLSKFNLPIMDYLFLEHQKGRSLRDLSKEFGLESSNLINRIFNVYELPRLDRLEAVKRKWGDPIYREEQRKKSVADLKRKWRNPRFRKKMSKLGREQMMKQRRDPEFVKKSSEASKNTLLQRWEDPEFRKKMFELLKQKWEDPEYRQKMTESSRDLWRDPEFRKKMSELGRNLLKKKWRDPAFREKISNLSSYRLKKKWEDPGFRENVIKYAKETLFKKWQDPEYRQKMSESTRNLWKDIEFREKMSEILKKRWEDPEYRQKMTESSRIGLKKKWEDPKFKERVSKSSRIRLKKRWEDSEFKKSVAEAVRRMRLDPQKIQKFSLPSIKGYRNDIMFYPQSIWEANIARILLYCNREFYVRETLRIKVDKKYKHLFKEGVTDKRIDFVVTDKRGNINLYEIVAYGPGSPYALAKLEMIIEQYPNLNLRIIDENSYKRLERWFKDKINSHPRFAGWETRWNNLKTNPEKYGK